MVRAQTLLGAPRWRPLRAVIPLTTMQPRANQCSSVVTLYTRLSTFNFHCLECNAYALAKSSSSHTSRSTARAIESIDSITSGFCLTFDSQLVDVTIRELVVASSYTVRSPVPGGIILLCASAHQHFTSTTPTQEVEIELLRRSGRLRESHHCSHGGCTRLPTRRYLFGKCILCP